MKRIDKILKNKLFLKSLKKNKKAEKNRKYCKHDINHLMDVARIGCILNSEFSLGFEKEIIYAAALLHDTGKWLQYKDRTPHNVTSANLADEILQKCGFSDKERSMIVSAIYTHRDYDMKDPKSLNALLFCADKKSRLCFICKMREKCNWDGEMLNMNLEY
ncbi:MAG: HD domain-containing protein [Firmicutes bacterium]|nr:HD domain-containing protein [Bacillota bacterium]